MDIDSSRKIHLPKCLHSPLFLPGSMCLVLSHFCMYVNIFEEKEIKKREKRLRFLDVKKVTIFLETN